MGRCTAHRECIVEQSMCCQNNKVYQESLIMHQMPEFVLHPPELWGTLMKTVPVVRSHLTAAATIQLLEMWELGLHI